LVNGYKQVFVLCSVVIVTPPQKAERF